MSPGVRRFSLVAHVTFSVGWVGAVIVFLALAAIGLSSQDPQTVRGIYLVMERAAWFSLVPLALASLISGTIHSLGTSWGLFRYHWVAVKLLINVFCTAILLIYMATLREMARVAADPSVPLDAIRNPSPLLHALLALVLLVTATVLAIYKPGGLIADRRRTAGYAVAIALALLVVVFHFAGGGIPHH